MPLLCATASNTRADEHRVHMLDTSVSLAAAFEEPGLYDAAMSQMQVEKMDATIMEVNAEGKGRE